jgi:uncharacterized membrane protein YvbJ
MKFCTKCGNEIHDGQRFCTKCGNDLTRETITETESEEETTNLIIDEVEESEEANLITSIPEEKEENNLFANINDENGESNLATNETQESHISNFKLSKKSKIVIAIAAILIIVIGAVIKIGNSLSDPKKLVTRFEKDVASNNASDLASILYSNDVRLKIDSKSISPLLSYFKSNPSYFNKVVQNLNNDSISPKDISSLSSSSSNTLTLVKAGKKFFIFPNYKLNVKPSFVDITTAVKDVTFSINDAQIGKSDADKSTKEFGPYIPGNYSILANYKGKYVTLSEPYSVDLVKANGGIAKLDVFNDMNYLNITSDYPDADIFINGKDINVKVKDAGNLGPINSSAKIYATCVKDGKKLKSEECSASSGDTELYLSFENASNDLNNVQDQLKDLLDYYTSDFTQAVNTNNISLIDPYVASGSQLYKDQQSYIPNTYNAGIQENIVSADIKEYNISDDNKSGTITTSEVYNIIAKDGTSSNKAFSYVYKFQYNDSTSSYQFTNISQAH